MDLKLIRNLVRIMERGEVDELEIEDDKAGLRVHLRRGPSGSYAQPSVMMMPGASAPGPAPGGGAPAAAGGGDGTSTEAPARAAGVEEITSPMIGTFYASPSPDADPFTAVGDRVGDESVVCIIEAMKVMNEIKAECSGEIVEILVENGEPVEYGQPLFLVKTR
ncbi:acetyl-CoA carboxylase biotin carboxyl carrier protein [Planctomycetota bacterium]|jgi:acetyl-CoA carboxylase biotin carboxyl carrier protein|nr:acetyl-CoA carboxylase biotin carboxyl carrier protein [Planctomycetota bacterium]MDB4733747.1 acetyl-CoA carboxylase biotin carboxyl carrier protein [Planctomycetota bacterium]MDC0585161.1 acetyl-CoA carboxylase biotin carboxyl carrier protein [Planctomycetota bacterium]